MISRIRVWRDRPDDDFIWRSSGPITITLPTVGEGARLQYWLNGQSLQGDCCLLKETTHAPDTPKTQD